MLNIILQTYYCLLEEMKRLPSGTSTRRGSLPREPISCNSNIRRSNESSLNTLIKKGVIHISAIPDRFEISIENKNYAILCIEFNLQSSRLKRKSMKSKIKEYFCFRREDIIFTLIRAWLKNTVFLKIISLIFLYVTFEDSNQLLDSTVSKFSFLKLCILQLLIPVLHF